MVMYGELLDHCAKGHYHCPMGLVLLLPDRLYLYFCLLMRMTGCSGPSEW